MADGGKTEGGMRYDRIEANRVRVSGSPGAVYLRLRRCFPDEPTKSMFSELTPGEAIAVYRLLGEAIREAVAGGNMGPVGR